MKLELEAWGREQREMQKVRPLWGLGIQLDEARGRVYLVFINGPSVASHVRSGSLCEASDSDLLGASIAACNHGSVRKICVTGYRSSIY